MIGAQMRDFLFGIVYPQKPAFVAFLKLSGVPYAFIVRTGASDAPDR